MKSAWGEKVENFWLTVSEVADEWSELMLLQRSFIAALTGTCLAVQCAMCVIIIIIIIIIISMFMVPTLREFTQFI